MNDMAKVVNFRKKNVIFGRPEVTNSDIKEVEKVLRSGWLGRGSKTEEFEKRFARYQRMKYAVATNSCTAALYLALEVIGIKPGDEVITSPITFAATGNVIANLGAKPIFVDVDRRTFNISPDLVERAITKKTKAVIPVHLTGRPCQMRKIRKLAQKHRLFVVADAAHAIEAEYQGKKASHWADFNCYSFYPNKNMTSGDGGMLVTNHKKYAEEAKLKSMHGLTKDAWRRYSQQGDNFYEVIYNGYNFSMNDIAAALGLSQFRRLERNRRKRKTLWQRYQQLLSGVKEIELPAPEEKNSRHARHLFIILLDIDSLKISRARLISLLKKRGIGTGVHFLALHLQKGFRDNFGYKKGDYPTAEYISERVLSLPFDVNLDSQDIKYVADNLKSIIKQKS